VPPSAAVGARLLTWGGADTAADLGRPAGYDVLLGADVLYSTGAWRALAQSAVKLLSPTGVLIIASTGHDGLSAPAEVAGFRAVAEPLGLRVESVETLPWRAPNGVDAQLLTARLREGSARSGGIS
jgi:hypothetical protein